MENQIVIITVEGGKIQSIGSNADVQCIVIDRDIIHVEDDSVKVETSAPDWLFQDEAELSERIPERGFELQQVLEQIFFVTDQNNAE